MPSPINSADSSSVEYADPNVPSGCQSLSDGNCHLSTEGLEEGAELESPVAVGRKLVSLVENHCYKLIAPLSYLFY